MLLFFVYFVNYAKIHKKQIKKALSKMYKPKFYEIIYIKQTFKGALQQDS
jgi:hypothetical protein